MVIFSLASIHLYIYSWMRVFFGCKIVSFYGWNIEICVVPVKVWRKSLPETGDSMFRMLWGPGAILREVLLKQTKILAFPTADCTIWHYWKTVPSLQVLMPLLLTLQHSLIVPTSIEHNVMEGASYLHRQISRYAGSHSGCLSLSKNEFVAGVSITHRCSAFSIAPHHARVQIDLHRLCILHWSAAIELEIFFLNADYTFRRYM